ncbi:hypothetical protein [Botrimarina hoheduenensis]|uniref:Uncharacterized protein n=1 Tax=Botrimarina hoheduenensis TaxID=2528000 RepID=A0A5C5VZW1_9BACT|nr:hypothetical protein [Botrimarina hoheduenensis]TWT43483.1 hypothetical protein Pla111_24340 [Botrimarina hoheduenensis]
MSPLFVNTEGRGRPLAPADRVQELHEFAQCIECYLSARLGDLEFAEYARFELLQSSLAACADLLSADDLDRFLEEAIATASEHFGYVKTGKTQ